MSVLKNKRNAPKPKLAAITTAFDIRNKLFLICAHKFYIRLEAITDPTLDIDWEINFVRNAVANEAFNLVKYVIYANSIYPYYEFEFNNRRNYQDLAICTCEHIIQIFTFANQMLKGDANKYKDIIEQIRLESNIIRGWKKSDNKALNKIREREEIAKNKDKVIIAKLEKENKELKQIYQEELNKYFDSNPSPEFALYRKEIEDWEEEVFENNPLPISPFIFNLVENNEEKKVVNPLLFGNNGVISLFIFAS